MPTTRLKEWSFPLEDLDSVEKIREYLIRHYQEHNEESAERIEDIGAIGISGLTTGYVVFPLASSVVTGSANLFWDNTNSRLSINTGTSPSVTLDVTGNALITGDTSLDGAVTLNTSAADKDFLVKGDTDTGLFLVDASTNRVGVSCVPSTTFENSGTFKSSGGAISLDNAVTVNTSEADVDFRVAGNTATNLFFIDASTDRIGVNQNTPTHLVHIVGAGLDDDAGSLLVTGGTQQFIQVDSASRARFICDAHDADASIEFQEDNVIKWVVGFDYTDTIAFTIGEGIPGTNNRLKIAAGGEVTIGGVTNIGTLTLTNGSITDSGGSIDFGNETLTGSGNINFSGGAAQFVQIDSTSTARFIADASNDDAFVDLQEDNTSKWTIGFDYTDSLKFKISEGAPGTNTRVEVISGGSMNVYDTGACHIQATAQSSGVARFMADSYTNDAYVELQEQNVLKWTAGFDYTDSNAYVISEGAPGTQNRFKIASGGGVIIDGTLTCGTITIVDGSSLNLQEDITFTGATTENLIKMPDNLAVALDITEASNSYLRFVTTDGSETIEIGKNTQFESHPIFEVTRATMGDNTSAAVLKGRTTGNAPSFDRYSLLVNPHLAVVGDIDLCPNVADDSEITFSEKDVTQGIPDGSLERCKIQYDFGDNVLNIMTTNAGGSDVPMIVIPSETDALYVEITKDLELSGGIQDYLFTSRADSIVLQGQKTGTNVVFELYTNDGDGTDSMGFQIYAKGAPSAIVNMEKGVFGYNKNDNDFELRTQADGTGTLRPIEILTEGNANQLRIRINGDVTMEAGNVGVGTSTFGTNADKTLALGTGVAPISSPPDCFQMYSADAGGVADHAAPHFRTENDVVIYLNQAVDIGSSPNFNLNTTAKTAAYTATALDDVITCGAGNETFTIDLPAVDDGKVFYIKNVGTGTITVDANTTGSTTIDGDTTQTVARYECLQVVCDASVYWAI